MHPVPPPLVSLPQIFQYNGAVFTLHVGLRWVSLFGRRERGGVVASESSEREREREALRENAGAQGEVVTLQGKLSFWK